MLLKWYLKHSFQTSLLAWLLVVSIPTSLCKLALPLRVQKQLATSTAKLEFSEKCLAAYHQVGLHTSILTRLLIYRSLRSGDGDESVNCRGASHKSIWWVELGSFHSHPLHLSVVSGQIQALAALLQEKGPPYEFMGEDSRRTGQSCLRDVGNILVEACPSGFLTIFLTMHVLLWQWHCQRPATSTSNNLSRMQNQRLLVQFWAPDDGRCVAWNMLSFI